MNYKNITLESVSLLENGEYGISFKINNMTSHKTWLDNEYSLWVKALQESTVHNFKEHPMVKRMLSEPDEHIWGIRIRPTRLSNLIRLIDNIGYKKVSWYISNVARRMYYYAKEVLKRNPESIIEIGGGVGQFYAILRALGYEGEYYIHDLFEVQDFQHNYLKEVEKQTGIKSNIPDVVPFDVETFCVSFYALGEFDNELKEYYIKHIVNYSEHGYIAWNAHSGATDDLTLFTHDIKVTEGREPNIKIIEW